MIRALFIVFLLAVSSAGITAQVRSKPDRESANILKLVKTDLDPRLKVESVTGFPDKSSLVTNRARTLKAFIICVPTDTEGTCLSRVFVTDIKTGRSSVIEGEPEEVEIMRPVDELKWLDNDRLSYERWMNPHFGHRYIFNVRTKKQTGAWILSDAK
jgi:hypothetical protein